MYLIHAGYPTPRPYLNSVSVQHALQPQVIWLSVQSTEKNRSLMNMKILAGDARWIGRNLLWCPSGYDSSACFTATRS